MISPAAKTSQGRPGGGNTLTMPTAKPAAAAPEQQQRRAGASSAAAPAVSPATQQAAAELKDIRERRNWLIHQLYTRQEYIHCLSVIEAQLRDTEGTCEYALYVKGLLRRMEGALSESMALLQAAVLVSPENAESRKQFGRALFLLGRHAEALEAFREAEALTIAKGQKDWEVELHVGLCLVYLGDYEGAVSAFVRSLGVQRVDSTFLHLGRTLVRMKSYTGAIEVYEEALEVSPSNADLQAALGQLYLKTGEVAKAFTCFGACLAEDPTHIRAIVAASSIIQTNGDYDVALSKYRIAVARTPDSAQLWNNIGACFFGKQARHTVPNSNGEGSNNNLYAAVSCLRKSIILAPFEWITNYNLGVVYMTLGRYVSAFHHLSAAISLNNRYAPAYMYLGVCLSLMNDAENACRAYERALTIEDDLVLRVNYAITLLNSGLLAESAAQLQALLPTWQSMSPAQQRGASPMLPSAVAKLQSRLAGVQPSHRTATGVGLPLSPAPLPGGAAVTDAPRAQAPARGPEEALSEATPALMSSVPVLPQAALVRTGRRPSGGGGQASPGDGDPGSSSMTMADTSVSDPLHEAVSSSYLMGQAAGGGGGSAATALNEEQVNLNTSSTGSPRPSPA